MTGVIDELAEQLIRGLRHLRDALEDGAVRTTPIACTLVTQLAPLEAAVECHDLAAIVDVLDRPVVRWVSSRGGPEWYARSLQHS
jgi:hypothetical protein